MTCRSAEDEIQRSLDGLLTPVERARLDAHIADCAACRCDWDAHRALARATGRWLRPLPQDDPGDAFTAAVLAHVTARPVSIQARPPLWLPLAATALLLGLLTWLPGLPLAGFDTVSVAARQTPGWLLSNLRGVPSDAFAVWGRSRRACPSRPGFGSPCRGQWSQT